LNAEARPAQMICDCYCDAVICGAEAVSGGAPGAYSLGGSADRTESSSTYSLWSSTGPAGDPAAGFRFANIAGRPSSNSCRASRSVFFIRSSRRVS
jgi:hypothetical protein